MMDSPWPTPPTTSPCCAPGSAASLSPPCPAGRAGQARGPAPAATRPGPLAETPAPGQLGTPGPGRPEPAHPAGRHRP